MPELNRANRETCDVDIRILETMAPFLYFDTANTTTAGVSSDSVHAMAKGSRRIAFQNPLEGTMSIEAQVYPFKLFSLLADGKIHNAAAYAVRESVSCAVEGELALAVSDGEIVSGTVFVYPEGQFGDAEAVITGTYAEGKFTAATPTEMAKDKKYEVGFVVNRTKGVRKITFNNKDIPQDYFITMRTVDKDEKGVLTPFLMTAYKATIQRSFELSFSSEGDPASVTLTFDLLEDANKNVLDMVEIQEELKLNPTTGNEANG